MTKVESVTNKQEILSMAEITVAYLGGIKHE